VTNERGRPANQDDDDLSQWVRSGPNYSGSAYANYSVSAYTPLSGASLGPLRREPVLAPPPETLLRYNARMLDPVAAYRLADQAPIRPTVYVSDQLIASGAMDEDARLALTEAASVHGVEIVSDVTASAAREHLSAIARDVGIAPSLPTRLRLVPASREARPAPDAWSVLQTFRGVMGSYDPRRAHVALDHLLTAASLPGVGGMLGAGRGVPSFQYPVAGVHGRQPVNSPGLAPVRQPDETLRTRRPVVAVLDSPVGRHPWLFDGLDRQPTVLGRPVPNLEVSDIAQSDAEATAHGTFVAGLIRQHCPDADILAIGLMGSDGVLTESGLLDALWMLAIRQEAALNRAEPAGITDVVMISAGFYHEQRDDLASASDLAAVLQTLGRLGVAVVAPAGNDATNRPMYPAAFTPSPGGVISSFEPDVVPLISVGASNPNGGTALFSNGGDWVACHRPGALVLSTLPLSGADTPIRSGSAEWRADADPTDFSGGFGLWSGTSFAAATLAGQLAFVIATNDLGSVDVHAAVARAWAAVTMCVESAHP